MPQPALHLEFDRANPRAVAWARSRAANLVRLTSDEMKRGVREAIRDVIGRAIEEGLPPRQAAGLIRSMVGLTARDTRAVARRHADLLRDGADAAFADRIADRYAEKLLTARAHLIAHTETSAAANAGQVELWRQAVDVGQLPANVQRVWITTPDDRLCPECAALDGTVAPLGGEFEGGIEGPPAHPACRCAQGIASAEDIARNGPLNIEPGPGAEVPAAPDAETPGTDFAPLLPSDAGYWAPDLGWTSTTPDDIARVIVEESVERGAAWDAQGRFVGSYSSNQANTITLPNKAITPGGRHLHNHPVFADPDRVSAAGFSPGDLDTATWFRLSETRVVSRLDGVDINYIARGFDKLTGDASAASKLGERISARIAELVKDGDSDRLVSRAFMRGTWGEEPSQSFGFAVKVHHALSVAAKEFGFSYEARWFGRLGSLDKLGTLDDALRLAGITW